MAQIAVFTIPVYALIVIFGGVFGYLKAKSKMSLISGLFSGAALLATWLLPGATGIKLGIATAIAAVLLITFIIRFVRTRKFMPAGLMMLLSLAATIAFALGWLA
ncbi:TMEM14 family protein [Microseira wollei]|uniref:Small integral membrane protein n=1 Tax=Microseira wollei NIES-4236 TaxID=2530354 RepID=A0AAV3XM81_9CYAN|nr:TMEM14 family protein [Microseira wollei]GET43594.1 protein of unknown function UPF0136 [Microseira wollei NIES-4236]